MWRKSKIWTNLISRQISLRILLFFSFFIPILTTVALTAYFYQQHSHITVKIRHIIPNIILLCLLIAFISIIFALILSYWIVIPIQHLSIASQNLLKKQSNRSSNANLIIAEITKSPVKELRILAESFQSMSAQLNQSLIDLGTQIEAQTNALDFSEQKFASIFRASPVPIMLSTLDEGYFIEVNDSFLKLFELTREEALSQTSLYLNIWQNPEDRRRMLRDLIGEGSIKNQEFNVRTKSGEIKTIQWSAELIYLNQKAYILSMLNDVTNFKQLEKSLAASETELRILFSGITDIVLILDDQGYYIKVAPTGTTNLYKPREELVGLRLHQVFPKEKADTFLGYIRHVLINQTSLTVEYNLLLNDKEVWFSTRISPLSERQVIWVARDFTSLKQAEIALENSLALQRAVLESISDGVLALDKYGNIVSYNHRFLQMWNINYQTLNIQDNQSRLAFLASQVEDSQTFLDKIVEIYGQPEAEIDDILKMKNGRVFERFSRPQKVGDKIVGRVWGWRDITARIRAEEAVQKSEAELRGLFAAMTDAVFVLNREGFIIKIVPTKTLLLNNETTKFILHTSILQYFPREQATEYIGYIARSIKSQTTIDFEYYLNIVQQGKTIMSGYFTAQISPISENTVLWIARDITDRKQAEVELREAQEKSENLLLNILPSAIVTKLKQNPSSVAEQFDEVTILFADIVGFTPISSGMLPITLVNLLNEIFSAFDQMTDEYGLEKIKTIGDAYMVVGGLPTPKHDHAESIGNMALSMQEKINQFTTPDGEPFKIRIGINTGSVVAGVIGIKKFIYDLWGDAVNVASRMESLGQPGKIQVSHATYERLRDKFYLERRGLIEVKGKGQMLTYWLNGKKNLNH